MQNSELVKIVAKQTGYSNSHVSNVLSGKRKNKDISAAAVKIQSANLISKIQKKAPKITGKASNSTAVEFNHSASNFSKACNISIPVKEMFAGLDKVKELGKTSILMSVAAKNVAKHHTGKETLTQRDLDMMYVGFAVCEAVREMQIHNAMAGMIDQVMSGRKG